MKNTRNKVIAVILSLTLVFSIAGAGIAATSFILNSNNSVISTSDGAVINVNSLDEAIEIMQNSPELFSEVPNVAEVAEETASVEKYDAPAEPIYPTVILPGISQSISYLANDDGTPAVNSDGDQLTGGLLIIDQSTLIPTLISDLATPLVASLIAQRNLGLSEGVYKTVTDLFAIQKSGPDGNPVNNMQTISYIGEDGTPLSVKEMKGYRDGVAIADNDANPDDNDQAYFYRMIPMKGIREIVGEENLYLYAFPLLGDPMATAEDLDSYIQDVKAKHGVDKVNIVTISLGGTIMTAYMELKKDTNYEDVNKIINVVGCLQGTDIMGDFYLRGPENFKLDDQFLYQEYVPMIFEESEGYSTYGHLINIAIKIFPKELLYNVLTAAVDGILDTLMLNCPQFWAMIPEDRFDDVKEKYSFIWDGEEGSGYEDGVLAAKIDKFHEAASNLDDNLKKFNSLQTGSNKNHSVFNVCGYNLDYACYDYNFFGIMKSSDTTNSDGIIDIDSTSLGATYARAGTVLPSDYVPEVDGYVSPEGSIDASTCLFPDNVWFFEGQHHEVGRNDAVISLVGQIISNQIKSTADKAGQYPQFNSHRNTKNIFRWYLDEAESILQPTERSVFTREDTDVNGIEYNCKIDVSTLSVDDIAELQAAYDEALLLLDDTICEPTIADATTERILNALRRVGLEGEAKDDTTDKILEKIATFLDDVLYKVLGAGGFTDVVTNGVLGGKYGGKK